MYKVILKTQDFLCDLCEIEIDKYFKSRIKKITKEIFMVEFSKEKDFFKFVVNMIYYSRTVENIYLDLTDFEKIEQLKEKGFNVLNLNIKDKNILVFDLVGFDLMQRDYLVNKTNDRVDLRAVILTLYFLELDIKRKSIKVIDPFANLGEVIIEASLFNPRTPLNIKRRFDFNITKFFNQIPQMPISTENNSSFTGVVLDNMNFKKIKENINFYSKKVKLSQFDFSWLDVKYKKEEFDFVISYFPKFKSEKEKIQLCDSFFYQAEFIAKQGIALISSEKIDLKYSRKYDLLLSFKKELVINNKNYFIYVF